MSGTLFLTFQSQLSVVMETVLKSAMFEITRLVEDSFLEEVGHRKQELEVLKRRLQLSESKLREREREWERERGKTTRCPDCGRAGDSSSRDESQPVETVRGADSLCLGQSLRDQSTNQPTLIEDVWSARQHLETNKQTTVHSHSKEKNDVHPQNAKEIVTPNSNAQIHQDFLQRLLGNSAVHSESTSDFKPRVSDLDKSEKTLDKEMDSHHSELLQSLQDTHEDLPASSPNGRVKTETELDLLPVKEEEEMVPVWDSVNRDDGCHTEMADPSQGELRGPCDQEEIQIGQRFAEHVSTEQGNLHPVNKQRTFSVVAREILTQFQVWQKACYSRNIEWGPITAKVRSSSFVLPDEMIHFDDLACFLPVLLISPLKHLEAVELKEVKFGETVALMCNLSFYSDIHWLKMSEGQLMALMVTSLKHTGELSVVWNYNETHFEGFMEKQTNGLRILHISTGDITTYFCATLYQKRLNFDKGVQLYTNQSKNKPFDQVQGPDGLSLHYQVFVPVLCFGLLGMLVTVLVVHMKTRKKNSTSSSEE